MKRKPWPIDTCDVCGKKEAVGFVVASAFGAHSNAVCIVLKLEKKVIEIWFSTFLVLAGGLRILMRDIRDLFVNSLIYMVRLKKSSLLM